MVSPTPTGLSKRDARYINQYEKTAGGEMRKRFAKSPGFSIAMVSDKLKCIAFLHTSTRYDVAGAVVRYFLLMGEIERSGRKFKFVRKR